jgi:hypothetical protein
MKGATALWHPREIETMWGGDRVDEGEVTRGGSERSVEPEVPTEAPQWAARWIDNSPRGNRSPDPSREHLFRC